MTTPTTTPTALGVFLDALLDYAGLFPPAKLPMEPAVQQYASYVSHPQHMMLARFIVPIARLPEFASAAKISASGNMASGGQHKAWRLSLLTQPVALPEASVGSTSLAEVLKVVCQSFATDVAKVADFMQTFAAPVHIEALEVVLPSAYFTNLPVGLLAQTVAAFDATLAAACLTPTLFFELPWNVNPKPFLHELAQLNHTRPPQAAALTKLRTGGVTPEAIPPLSTLASFIVALSETSVGCKATAGLHNPLRAHSAAVGAPMHGFLNVFGALICAHAQGLAQSEVEKILASEVAEDFIFTDTEFVCQGFTVPSAQLAHLRKTKAISFGSCSFEEPVWHLAQHGYIHP